MKGYFELQYVLTNRKIKEAGLNPLLGYVLGLTAFVLLSEYIFHMTEFAKYLLILTCLSILLKLSAKNRTDFLLSTFGQNSKIKIRVIENLILCIPFVSILSYKELFFEACILLLCSVTISLISFQSNYNIVIPTPFSKRPFEFSTGFRKTFFLFPIAYALTYIAISVDNLNLGIFSMLLIFLTTLSYYSKPENDYYVWVHSETPKSFLVKKIIVATTFITLLVIPILTSLLIFYTINFEMIILFFLIGTLFLWTIILAKYSAYPKEMSLPEGIVLAFSLYFPPLLLVVILFFYTKSISNLKLVLND